MEWQVDLISFPLSGNVQRLAGALVAKLSQGTILRHVASRPALQGLGVMYTGQAKALEQAVSDLASPGVQALEEVLRQAGQPVGVYFLEIIPAEWGRLGLPEPD